jgi:Ca-activated chloride channel family protein
MFLETAHPDMLSSQGTALGEALKLAQNFYDSDADTNKYLFVVSDGEDHEENARDITKNLKELGVKVYALGLGTTQGGPIPINKIGGVQYKKDAEGNMVITQAHPEALKEIANIGKGKFWNGNHTKESIDAVTDMINEADKKEFESKEFSDYKDQFQWFIGLGLLLLLLDVLILEKKTAWLQKLNLFNEKVPKS